jgi:hypothetical protein
MQGWNCRSLDSLRSLGMTVLIALARGRTLRSLEMTRSPPPRYLMRVPTAPSSVAIAR